jgi:hypothetical protein
MAEKGVENGVKYLSFQQNTLEDNSAEKAGVGGSIPSLATTFSMAYAGSAAPDVIITEG